MTIEGDVVQSLKAYAPLASLVGGRVVPDVVRSAPCVVYQRISTGFQQTLGRHVAAEDARIQLAAWSRDYDEAESIAREVVAGVLAMPLNGTRSIKATVIDEERSDWDPTAELYRRMVDVVMVTTEAGS